MKPSGETGSRVPIRTAAAFATLLVLVGFAGASAEAPVEGPRTPDLAAVQDTILRDTILPVRVPPPDELPADSVRARLAAASETIEGFEPAVQVLPRNVPTARGGAPSRPETGVWEFDREALLSTHAMTLHDLLSLVPGTVLLRGGDYGNPVAITSAGLGPGQIRVFRDGIEEAPIEGGVVDLGQVALAGLESVRVERRPGELRIHLESQRIDDVRPYTLLDVSTGDLQTNTFRATFAHPNALGGTVLFALDRIDTEGRGREEPGAVYGAHFRYALFHSDDLGLSLHYRSRSAQRPEGVFRPIEVDRTDMGFHAGWALDELVTVEAFGNRTSVSPGSGAEEGADSLLPAEARSVLGTRASAEWERVWARAEGRIHGGDGWPTSVFEVEVGGRLESLGGATVALERERWEEGDPGHSLHGRIWTEPVRGVSLFAEMQDARRGVPRLIPPEPEPDDEEGEGEGDPLAGTRWPDRGWGIPQLSALQDDDGDPGGLPGNGDDALVRFGERRGVRAGVRAQFRGLDVTAAYLRAEADSLAPVGLPFDRGGATVPGGVRTGVEFEAHLPLDRLREGLFVSGHAQFWEPAPEWRYHPERSWAGTLGWHHVGYDSNLEVWFDAGARGRDGMAVPVAGADTGLDGVPSSLSWFTRLQFRILTVRVFVHWENFTLRDNLQDIPNRLLPRTRAIYGIRWTMWN